MMMGSTLRDLGSTIKEAKASFQKSKKQNHQEILEDENAEDFESSRQHQESMN
jgi:Sec-independent protein translocase protein TatA